jgi:hypothetical protein
MKLFKYEGYEVKVAPEALTLKPFKKLWTRDKSKDKERAIMEFGFLYFYCDPRSDYQYIIDEEDRLAAVKEGQGFPEDWKPDATLKSAMEFYSTFDTSSAMLLRAAMKAVKKVQDTLDELNPDDTKSLKEYLTALKMIPEVASMIQEAEKALNQEMEYGEAKGSIEKTLFDDGLDNI